MHRLIWFLTICFIAVALSACFNAADTVHARAAHDFGCPEDRITVTNVSGTSYSARGCGQEAVYTCSSIDSASDDIKCILDTAQRERQ